jgi:hypothetical protein
MSERACRNCGSALVRAPNSHQSAWDKKKYCSDFCRHHSVEGIWRNMISRCYNPKCAGYGRYGGRGITVCLAWVQSFETFAHYVGKRPTPEHSIDRIDNNGNYEPGNVRWATRTEQVYNTRANRIIEFDGRSMSLTQWASEVGIDPRTIHTRLRRGWSIPDALSRTRYRKPRPDEVGAAG